MRQQLIEESLSDLGPFLLNMATFAEPENALKRAEGTVESNLRPSFDLPLPQTLNP